MRTTCRRRFVSIAWTWPAGAIVRVHVLDNRESALHRLDGDRAPRWLRERVALLRLGEVSSTAETGPLGRRFKKDIFHVFLDGTEYRHLLKVIESPGDGPTGGRHQSLLLAHAASFKPRTPDPRFQAWLRALITR